MNRKTQLWTFAQAPRRESARLHPERVQLQQAEIAGKKDTLSNSLACRRKIEALNFKAVLKNFLAYLSGRCVHCERRGAHDAWLFQFRAFNGNSAIGGHGPFLDAFENGAFHQGQACRDSATDEYNFGRKQV